MDLRDLVLPLMRSELWVHVLQLLGAEEEHLSRKIHGEAGEGHAQGIRRLAHRVHDGLDRSPEGVLVPLLGPDDLLPVPLVHVDGVQIIQLFVPTDGVHVREQTLAGPEPVALQRQPFPFRQGVDHLALHVHGGDVEAYGPLVAVQIVVETGIRGYKQRSRHPPQIQGAAQVDLETVFDKFDSSLHFVHGQGRPIPLRNVHLAHTDASLGKL